MDDKLKNLRFWILSLTLVLVTLFSIQTLAQVSSANKELVFTPITPCRIIDTRNAGGEIAASTVRSFFVTSTSSYAGQGGSNTNCGGAGSDGLFTAAMINFTVVYPQNDGYITVYPAGTARPVTSALNYYQDQVVGNSSTFKLTPSLTSPSEFSVFSTATTHLVADLVGYFSAPKASSLECYETNNTITIGAQGYNNAYAPACAAGYLATGSICHSNSINMFLRSLATGVCTFQNNGFFDAEVTAGNRCCRVAAR
jgi:hypothetical protein